MDAASSEVIATLTAVAVSSATVFGLARIIRQANGFDQSQIVLETVKPQTVPAIAATKEGEKIVETSKPTTVDITPTAPTYDNSAAVAEVKSWISDWRNKTESIAASAAATIATPPSSPSIISAKADPAAAAAVLTALTADTPVGVTAPTETEEEEVKPALATVGAAVIAPDEDDGAVQAAPQPQQAQRVVTISDTHLEKVSAMWASFKEQTEKKAQLLAKHEKLTLDIAALEAVEHESKKQSAVEDKKEGATFVQRIVAFFVNIWAMIVEFVRGVYRGRFGGASA